MSGWRSADRCACLSPAPCRRRAGGGAGQHRRNLRQGRRTAPAPCCRASSVTLSGAVADPAARRGDVGKRAPIVSRASRSAPTRVTFELAGFKKFVRGRHHHPGGLQRGGQREARNLDRPGNRHRHRREPGGRHASTTLSASFTKEALEKIPNARDPWVIVEQTPGMIMSGVERRRQPVGPADVVHARWAAARTSSGTSTAR